MKKKSIKDTIPLTYITILLIIFDIPLHLTECAKIIKMYVTIQPMFFLATDYTN